MDWHRLTCALSDFHLKAELKLVISERVYLTFSVWNIHGSHKSETNKLRSAVNMKIKTGKLE